MTGWYCNDCKMIVEPEFITLREYDGLDSGPYRYSSYVECDECAGDDVEEVTLCSNCHYQKAEDDGLCLLCEPPEEV